MCCSSVLSPPTPRPKVSSRSGVRLRLREGGEISPLPGSHPSPCGEAGEGIRGGRRGDHPLHGAGWTPVSCVCLCVCVRGSQSLERGEGGPGLL